MRCNYSIDQGDLLFQKEPIVTIPDGVCASMVTKWLHCELSDAAQNAERSLYKYPLRPPALRILDKKRMFSNAYSFTARQRAMDDYFDAKGITPYALKSDSYTAKIRNRFPSRDLVLELLTIKSGFFCIELYNNDTGYGHCIGLSITNGTYRIFDPNHGEFETTNHQDHHQALLECQKHILDHYPVVITPHISLHVFKPK